MTSTDSIWSNLGSIPIGTVVSWVIVVSLILGALCTACIKAYKIFEKSHKLKEENDEMKQMVKDHDNALVTITEQLAQIQHTLDRQDEATLKSMRHSIVRACEEAIVRKTITIREYRSLHEMYGEYHNRHGNGYVTSLITKLDNKVDIIGKLDNNDRDIEE